jgi:NADH-quinone oxidoreductase subunit F
MTCLGRCHENGAFHYQGKNYSAKSAEEIDRILSNNTSGNTDNYNVEASGTAVLTAPFPGFDSYYALLNNVLHNDSIHALNEIKKAKIRGRGGAGFPMGIKLESCRNVESDQKFIICNADEGDPGAYSDRYLLEKRPHSVLFGMMIAGFVTGADYGILYIRAEYPEATEIVQEAIKQLKANNLLGDNI